MPNYVRFRERGGYTALPTTYLALNWDGTSVESVSERPDINGTYENMTDYVSSNFVKRSKAGEIFNKPMVSNKYIKNVEATTTILEKDVGGGNKNVYTYTGGQYLLGGPSWALGRATHLATDHLMDMDRLLTLAGTAAEANIESPEFYSLTFIAELRETMRFMRNPLRSIANTVQRAQRNAKKQRKNALKLRKKQLALPPKLRGHDPQYIEKFMDGALTTADFISANWLSYRYGIVPMQMDVADAVKAIQSLALQVDRKTARGFHEESHEVSTTWNSTNLMDLEKDITTIRTQQVRAGVLYSADCRDTFGVELKQLPLALWEAIPLSFLTDWAHNLTDYYQAIVPKTGVKVYARWSTTKDIAKTTADGSMSSIDGSIWSLATPGTSTEELETVLKSRIVRTQIGLSSKPTIFDGDLGLKRLIDVASLITQVLSSKI